LPSATPTALITLKLKIPSFIATLGMLFMARSLAIVLAGGFPPVFPRELDVSWLVGPHRSRAS
jgi:simple sugar transport system permease protein